VILVTVIGIARDAPTSEASGAELATFYEENRIAQFVGIFVFATAAPLLVLFSASLATRLGPAGSGLGVWGAIIVAGAVLTAGGILLTATLQLALVDGADQPLSGAALEGVNADGNATRGFVNTGVAAMTLGVAGALLAGRERRALGFVALVLGIALLVPWADFVALLITLAWIAVVGVLLARRPVRSVEAAVPTGS
jgi:hypothetical protein